MATVAGVGSGALSGAAAGTAIAPGYGTAIGAVLGALSGAFSGDGGAAAQQALSANQQQLTQNQLQYSKGLNSEALRRAIAGSTDAEGSSIRYDPATNQWVSTLGKRPQAIQGGIDSATQLHNTVDVPQAEQNNAASSITASLARRGLSGAINNFDNYQPVSQARLYGALQDASTRANQISEHPIIADTLRQFARTGASAGPVLSQLERASGDTLSQEMSQNVIKAMTGASDVNTSNRQSLAQPIATLINAGTPSQQNTSPSFTAGPSDALAAQTTGRAVGSSAPATAASGASAYGTIASNQAANLAFNAAGNSPLPGQLASINQSAQTLGNSGAFKGLGTTINDFFNTKFGGVSNAQNPNVTGVNEQFGNAGGFT